jgi:hypothetical protein
MSNLTLSRPLLALVCLLALAGLPSIAEEPAEGRAPDALDLLAKDLNGIGAHYKNSKVKIGRGMSGASSSAGGAGPVTPAEACCDSNLKIVERKLQMMAGRLEQLYAYYSDRRDDEAITELQVTREELIVVSKGFAAFKVAKTDNQAREALLSILRPYDRLRRSIETLKGCCPIDPKHWAGPPSDAGSR